MSAAVESVGAELLAVALGPELRAYGPATVDVVFVTVRDRDGAEGTGFTYTLGAGAGVVCRMVDDVIAPALVGADAEDWPRVHDAVAAATRRLGPGVFAPALSAVDIAVWDLRGRRTGRPLYQLLGGSEPTAFPIYGSGRAGNSLTVDELVEHSAAYVAEGYAAVKVRAGARGPDEDVARLAAVRAALGADVPLMVDCNEQLDVAAALRLGCGAADLGYLWLEEPLPAEDLRGHAQLAGALPIAVAAGEHLAGAAAFDVYLAHSGVRMFQPDAALTGGITETVRIAELLGAADRAVSYHSLADLHIHLAAGTGVGEYVEDFPILSGIQAEWLRPGADGTVRPPDRPGHGIRWDCDAIARSRY